MTEQGEKEVHDTTVRVSATELEELRRLRIVEEAKNELVAWGRRWATIFTIIVVVVGLIGLNVIVATVIRGFVQEDIEEARKSAIVATESSKGARIEMEKATKAAQQYVGQLQQMKGEADKIAKTLKRLQASLEGKGRSVREEARLLTADLGNRLGVLEKNLAEVIAAESESKAAEFRTDTDRLEREAANRRVLFQDNSEYTAQIAFYESTNSKADPIAGALEQIGFQTAITAATQTPEKDTGVPIGAFSEATKVIIAHDEGEELKAGIVAKTVDSVLGKGSVQIIAVPPSPSPKWIIVFLPKEK